MSVFGIATGRSPQTPFESIAQVPMLNFVAGAGLGGEGKAAPLGQQVLTGLGALAKWLPAEVVAGYGAAVLLMQPQVDLSNPNAALHPNVSWAAWLICLVASPVLVLLLAIATRKIDHLWAKALLSIPAFALRTGLPIRTVLCKLGGGQRVLPDSATMRLWTVYPVEDRRDSPMRRMKNLG